MVLDSTAEAVVRRPLGVPLLPLFIAAYAATAFAVAPPVFTPLLLNYARQMTLLAEILIVAIPLAGIILRPASPLTMIGEIVRNGALRLAVTVVTFCVGMAAFTSFKISIPRLVPFYGDVHFADIDEFLHGGNPGLFLHHLIPEWAAQHIVFAYSFIWFSAWFGLLGFVALQRNAALRRHYFWTMALAFVLVGTILATALSSVGPIFYDHFIPGGRFEELMSLVLNGGAGSSTSTTANYLLAAYEGGGEIIGTGISAMPSMHVTIVTLNALMLSSINRYLGVVGWLYAGLILMSSVYLGWHYAIDGYVSIVVVSLLWWGIGKIARRPPRLVL